MLLAVAFSWMFGCIVFMLFGHFLASSQYYQDNLRHSSICLSVCLSSKDKPDWFSHRDAADPWKKMPPPGTLFSEALEWTKMSTVPIESAAISIN